MKLRMFEDTPVPVRLKVAMLWVSVMFCYVYGDYFDLYRPGKLQGMLQGQIVPLGAVSQGVLFGTTVLMVVPSLMIFLSVVLKVTLCRWLNIIVGAAYTIIMLMIAISDGWLFYRFLAVVEVMLTSFVVLYAWRWPRKVVSAAAA